MCSWRAKKSSRTITGRCSYAVIEIFSAVVLTVETSFPCVIMSTEQRKTGDTFKIGFDNPPSTSGILQGQGAAPQVARWFAGEDDGAQADHSPFLRCCRIKNKFAVAREELVTSKCQVPLFSPPFIHFSYSVQME